VGARLPRRAHRARELHLGLRARGGLGLPHREGLEHGRLGEERERRLAHRDGRRLDARLAEGPEHRARRRVLVGAARPREKLRGVPRPGGGGAVGAEAQGSALRMRVLGAVAVALWSTVAYGASELLPPPAPVYGALSAKGSGP